jgi:hypothetical protein
MVLVRECGFLLDTKVTVLVRACGFFSHTKVMVLVRDFWNDEGQSLHSLCERVLGDTIQAIPNVPMDLKETIQVAWSMIIVSGGKRSSNHGSWLNRELTSLEDF